MRSPTNIKSRIDNLDWALIRLKQTSGIFNSNKDLILTTQQSIEELNWALGKPRKEVKS